MTILPFTPKRCPDCGIGGCCQSTKPSKPTSPGALDVVRDYFDRVHPSRGNGATDCGEFLDGSGAMPAGDYFLLWLAERGFLVVPS